MRQDNKRIAEHISMEASQDVFVTVSVVEGREFIPAVVKRRMRCTLLY
jgi:hypothetical protein